MVSHNHSRFNERLIYWPPDRAVASEFAAQFRSSSQQAVSPSPPADDSGRVKASVRHFCLAQRAVFSRWEIGRDRNDT